MSEKHFPIAHMLLLSFHKSFSFQLTLTFIFSLNSQLSSPRLGSLRILMPSLQHIPPSAFILCHLSFYSISTLGVLGSLCLTLTAIFPLRRFFPLPTKCNFLSSEDFIMSSPSVLTPDPCV